MAEQHSTIRKYDPRKNEYFYTQFRARFRELVVLFGIGSVVSLAVFSLRSGCCPLRRLLRFLSHDFLGFPD